MQYKITSPNLLRGMVSLPSSKSICNRALIINALSNGNLDLKNLSDCDDTHVMVKALTENSDIVDIMAAGTAMRFLTAYFSVRPGEKIMTGTERMKNRPIKILVNTLRTLGIQVEYLEKEGYPPLRIMGGKHEGGTVTLPGNVSSQYISALLMIAPELTQGLTLNLTGHLISKPYIDLTIKIMKDFGADVKWISEQSIEVKSKPYRTIPYYIENDWSGASYWYEMVALSKDEQAEILLPGLFMESYQGDSTIQQIFKQLGVNTSFISKEGITCVKLTKNTKITEYMEYDFVNQPDLAQTFVVTCCLMGVSFHFTGLQSLKIKETDRIAALRTELKKMGFLIQEENNSELIWKGERCDIEPNYAIDTYEDHRMAMAFAPCSLVIGEIKINEPQVVTKSYPHYWEDLNKIGFSISK